MASGLVLARICSAVFTQVKGCLGSFQASRKRWMALRRVATLRDTPRRRAVRPSRENQVSRWFIQLALVGVKCR